MEGMVAAWDERRAAAEHWAAAAEGMMVMMASGDESTGAAEMDEAMPMPMAPLAPPPTPPVASASSPAAAPEGHEEGEEAAGEDGALNVMRAPVLEDGASLLDRPDLVWAEDTWDAAREEEARAAAERQGGALPPHRVEWYERTAGRHWDLFYKRNEDRFFKDRHYLLNDFPDLVPPGGGGAPSSSFSSSLDSNAEQEGGGEARPRAGQTVLVEAGCGVGNAVFPLLEAHPAMFVYALDFSGRAIELVRQHPLYASTRRCRAFVCDLVQDAAPPQIVEEGGADLVLLMYALSAMAPEAMPAVARKLFSLLKPGGRVLLRDYGRWDEAQLRFKRGHKLAEHFYLRSDGTRAYYFSLEDLRRIFVEEAGFHEVEAGYIRRQYANRGQGATRRRTWVHARFEKKGEKADGGMNE